MDRFHSDSQTPIPAPACADRPARSFLANGNRKFSTTLHLQPDPEHTVDSTPVIVSPGLGLHDLENRQEQPSIDSQGRKRRRSASSCSDSSTCTSKEGGEGALDVDKHRPPHKHRITIPQHIAHTVTDLVSMYPPQSSADVDSCRVVRQRSGDPKSNGRSSRHSSGDLASEDTIDNISSAGSEGEDDLKDDEGDEAAYNGPGALLDSNGVRVRQSSREVADRIPLELLQQHYHVPLSVVAKKLRVSNTMLKKLCRRYRIQRWPHRQISSLDKEIAKLQSARGGAKSEKAAHDLDIRIRLHQMKRDSVVCAASSGADAERRAQIFQAKPGEPEICGHPDLQLQAPIPGHPGHPHMEVVGVPLPYHSPVIMAGQRDGAVPQGLPPGTWVRVGPEPQWPSPLPGHLSPMMVPPGHYVSAHPPQYPRDMLQYPSHSPAPMMHGPPYEPGSPYMVVHTQHQAPPGYTMVPAHPQARTHMLGYPPQHQHQHQHQHQPYDGPQMAGVWAQAPPGASELMVNVDQQSHTQTYFVVRPSQTAPYQGQGYPPPRQMP